MGLRNVKNIENLAQDTDDFRVESILSLV